MTSSVRTWERMVFGLALVMGCGDSSADTSSGSESDESSASEDSESGAPEAPDFAAEIQPIFESACLCHFMPATGDAMTAPYLTLNAGVGLGELVDVDSVQLPSMKRVAPADVDNSYLVHKLRGTHADVGGPMDTNTMPPLAPLSEDEILTIEAWIAAGAS